MKWLSIFVLFFSIPFVAVAQKDLSYIVHTGPGSASDVITRAVAKELEKKINQNVVVQNAPGAEGLVALSALSLQKQPSLFSSGTSLHVFSHVVNNTDTDILKVLGTVATGPTLWYTHPNSNIKNAADLVDAFKQNKPLRIGSDTLSGRINSISLQKFYPFAKSAIVDVPYKTSNQVAMDVAGGNIEIGLTVSNPGIKALIDQGKIIPIAVTTLNPVKIGNYTVPSLNKFTKGPQFVAAWIISTHRDSPVSSDVQKALFESFNSAEVEKIVTNLGLIYDVKNDKETVKFINDYIKSLRALQNQGIDLK